MDNIIEKRPYLTLGILCLLLFFLNLDTLYVNIMEARNFVTAREMLQDNHWILTTMNEFPRYEKPPLPTWLTAASGALFGIDSRFAMRLPAAFMALMTCFFCYRLVLKRMRSSSLALYGSMILVTSFYILFSGRNGQWDIFTHAFMLGAIYYSIKACMSTQGIAKYWVFTALFLAASILSKGPVSLYALWLPALIAYIWVYRSELRKKHLPGFLGSLVGGLLLGAAWFAYVRYTDPEYFLQITAEETANWGSYNVRPFYYYWSFFTQSGLWTIPALVSLLYPYLKTRVADLQSYRFSLIWTLASVVLLSLIPEKKSRYLLPVLIPLAINTAFYLQYLIKNFSPNWKIAEKLPVYLHFGLLILISLIFIPGGFFFFKDTPQFSWTRFFLTGLALLGSGWMMWQGLRQGRLSRSFTGSIAFIAIVMSLGFPLASALYKNTAFQNISILRDEPISLYSYGEPAPEMIWELGRSAPNLITGDSLNLPEEDHFGILVGTGKEADFKRIFEPQYQLQFQTTFDLNYPGSPGSSSHKDRLLSHYYLVTKK